MPRIDKKSTRIAYAILGVPANMKKPERDKKSEQIDKRLVFEETVRVR